MSLSPDSDEPSAVVGSPSTPEWVRGVCITMGSLAWFAAIMLGALALRTRSWGGAAPPVIDAIVAVAAVIAVAVVVVVCWMLTVARHREAARSILRVLVPLVLVYGFFGMFVAFYGDPA
jgi:hypothetical protein